MILFYKQSLRFCFFISSFVLLFHKANAFVEVYSIFGPQEFETINNPSQIDGEYYSDLLAYRHSLKSDYKFLNSKQAYDLYVGSVSSTRFAIQQRLKLNQEISKKLNFDLVYIDRENLEEGREQFLIGLTYSLFDGVGLSSYTSLFSNKEDNNVGFSLNLSFNSKSKLKFFVNLIDFDFNKRNEIGAKDEQRPMHYGFLGSWQSDFFQFIEYYFYKNSNIVRNFSLTDQQYIFEETRLGFRGRKKLKSDFYLNFDIDAFESEEGLFSTIAPDPVTDSRWSKKGYRFLTQIEWSRVILGVEHNYRYWSSSLGRVKHLNYMPHIWYNIPIGGTSLIPKSIDLGLEASIHDAEGLRELRSETDSNSDLNSRLNLKLYYEFSPTALLNLLLSADLDDWSWEGGVGQFQILF